MNNLADRLLLYRFLTSTALFGGAVVLLLVANGWQLSLPVIVLAAVLLAQMLVSSVMMLIALRWEHLRYSRAFLAVQLITDAVLLVPAVSVSGGTSSPFAVVYILIILATAFVHSTRFAVTMSLFCSFLIAAVSYLEASGSLPGLSAPTREQILRGVLLRDLIYFATFFVFGVMPARLAERLRIADARLDDLQRDYRLVQQLQRLVVEHVPSGIAIVDENGHLLLLNPSGRRILDRVFGLEEGLAWLRKVAEDARSGATALLEETREYNGRTVVVGYAAHPMDSDLLRGAWLVVFQDVTERRELARQLERQRRLAAIGELSANLAHEVRNPLAAISNSLQVLQQNRNSAAQSDRLFEIQQREIQRLNDLVTNFLEFARPGTTELVTGDPSGTIARVVEVLEHDPEIGKGIIQTRFDVVPDITYDDRLLGQVADNLIRNAVQWRREGTTVSVVLETEDQGKACLRVVNQGPEIPQDVRERLFEPFVSSRDGGTGLGLSIAWRAAEAMNAELDLVRSDGEETEFVVRFSTVKDQQAGNG